jgi:hypothetical protein
MAKAKTIQELKQQFDTEVFSEFKGMDDEYRSLIYQHHQVAEQLNLKYSRDYVTDHRKQTIVAIDALRRKYVDKAFDKLGAIENDHKVKKNPKMEPSSVQEKLLFEIQRMNNMNIIKAKLESLDFEKLVSLYDEYKDDEDFLVLLDAKSKDLSETDKIRLQHHIKAGKENPFLEEVERTKNTLCLLGNGSAYPSYADAGFSKQKFRGIESDLSNKDKFKQGWN